MKKLHALVLGATGATGQELVKLLIKDPKFDKVSIFVRQNPQIEHNKLVIHKIDFSKLGEYKAFISGDVLFSALGTTLKDAGSKAQQFLVDYTYQYEFAKMASENQVTHYSLVSSLGANKNSWFFYLKTKGALEEAIKGLPFNKTHIFQPPTLMRQKNLVRKGEKRGIKIINALNRIGLLKSQKPLSVADLAKKMLYEFLSEESKELKTYKPKDIF